MRVEGAARKADISRPVLTEAFHQISAPADGADREPSAKRLAVGHHVGAHAEVFLGAAGSKAEADQYFVENEHDMPRDADRAQLFEPRGVGGAIQTRTARAVNESRISGAR